MLDKKEAIISKLNEYGMIIFGDYQTEEKNVDQHIFICEGMTLFLDNNDGSLSASFYAGLKPEEVARDVLILNEMDEFDELYIMESYVINNDNEFVCGDEAFDLLKKAEETKILKTFIEKSQYENILRTTKCYSC